MERSQALNEGLTTFETGRPCKNGHFAKRYTSSGGCSACIQTTTNTHRDTDTTPRQIEKAATRDYLTHLIEIQVRVFDVDVRAMQETANGLCRAVHPGFTEAQLRVGKAPIWRHGPHAVYSLRVPPDHVGLLMDISLAMFNARHIPADVEAIRARVLRDVSAMNVNPKPEWKP